MGPRHPPKPIDLTEVAQLTAQTCPLQRSCILVSPLRSPPRVPSKDAMSHVAQPRPAACGGAVGSRVGHRRCRPHVPPCCVPQTSILIVPFFNCSRANNTWLKLLALNDLMCPFLHFGVTLNPQDLSYCTGDVKISETGIHVVRLDEGMNTKGHTVLGVNTLFTPRSLISRTRTRLKRYYNRKKKREGIISCPPVSNWLSKLCQHNRTQCSF